MTTSTDQVNRLYKALVVNGEQLTAQQIKSRYRINNPHDAVYQLRRKGYAIYLNEVKNSKNVTHSKYRAGTPSREIVAAGYRAMSIGI